MIMRTFVIAFACFLLRDRLKTTLRQHLLPPCVLSGEAQSVVENIGFQALDSTATATVRVVVTLDCPDSNEKNTFFLSMQLFFLNAVQRITPERASQTKHDLQLNKLDWLTGSIQGHGTHCMNIEPLFPSGKPNQA